MFKTGPFVGIFKSSKNSGDPRPPRYRGNKFTIDSLLRKRQSLDALVSTLVNEATCLQEQWRLVPGTRTVAELAKLDAVMSRLRLLHLSLIRLTAEPQRLSKSALCACGLELEGAMAQLSRLHLELKVSAARVATIHPPATIEREALRRTA